MPAATISASEANGVVRVELAGEWTVAGLPTSIAPLQTQLRRLADRPPESVQWRLQTILRLDSAAAILLWHAWGRRWPSSIELSAAHRQVIERVAASAGAVDGQSRPARDLLLPLLGLGRWVLTAIDHLRGMIALLGQLILDLIHLGRHPRDMPWREFSAHLYKSGAQALPVTTLIGFLIGIVVSYLAALQLKSFGADVLIVNLLGIGIVRELGPVLVAVLVAGRSGSAMTAQIGVMRVTEEIDALATMGVSRSLRLVLPKVLALTVAMPLLVVWCSVAGIVGGMISAKLQMDLSYGFFIEALPRVVPVANWWIGIGKGAVFGLLIAIIACHFGLRVAPNTESLSARTTAAVVTAITVSILVDAVFAILTRGIGIPL
ncbi:MAG: ABC transporter permease [Candidatus Accumulibacter sp.]|nr:ABC transporter permease [Accumulibacter sp.]